MNTISTIPLTPQNRVAKPIAFRGLGLFETQHSYRQSQPQTDEFQASYANDAEYIKAKKYVDRKDFINSILLRDSYIQNYNAKKMEGLQKGIKVFEGLSMKQIAFMLEDLQTIMISRGCFNNCTHCYANAKPQRENMSYEDFQLFTAGLQELQQRTDAYILKSNLKRPHIVAFYDSDGILLELKDKNGGVHDYTEIADMLYNATNVEQIFDTAGWNIKDKKAQARAEKYVEYFKNHQYQFSQINISINPFHSLYTKSLELEQKGDMAMAQRMRKIYVDRIANTLTTFTPIFELENFNLISRAFNNKYDKLSGYTLNDLTDLEIEIMEQVNKNYEEDLKHDKKYVSTPQEKANKLTTLHRKMFDIENLTVRDGLLIVGRAKDLFLSKYGSVPVQEFEDSIWAEDDLIVLKNTKKINAVNQKYKKILAPNGQIYITDIYRLIPTDIRLNFSNKDEQTYPLPQMETDFVVTEDML